MAGDPTVEIVGNLLRSRLRELQQLSGLPIVFGGSTRRTSDGRRFLVIEELSGTLSGALDGLTVPAGRGLGGATIASRAPKLVRGYKDDASISHDFDLYVVDLERITSIFAFPIQLDGDVGAVVYGAVRDLSTIGDHAVRCATVVVQKMEKDLGALFGKPNGGNRSAPGPDSLDHRVHMALGELRQIIETTADDNLRYRLERVRRHLGGMPPDNRRGTLLSPRELDALRLVAVGATNAEIAAQLGLSPQTVKAYLRSAMRKLEVHNRGTAVHVARQEGAL